MSMMTKERKEYLKNYQRNELRRIPLDVTYDMHIKILQHMAIYGKKKSTNGYIKESLNLIMEIEDAGIKDDVIKMVEKVKALQGLGAK